MSYLMIADHTAKGLRGRKNKGQIWRIHCVVASM